MPPVLALEAVAATFGAETLFEDVSFAIDPGARLALVGRNGTGKSTLLRILAGLQEPDEGRRHIDPKATLSLLAQAPRIEGYASLLGFVAAGLPAHRSSETHAAAAALDELGLDPERTPEGLSGGEERRAALARAIVSEPTILLLDEPTNHLDLAGIEWLEERLASFTGAAIIVSHDRALLKRWSTSMLWLMGGTGRHVARGFREFEPWSDEIYTALERENERRTARLKLEESWLVHGVSARRKRNQRRLQALHDLRSQHKARFTRQGDAALSLGATGPSGDLVIEAEGLSFERAGRSLVSGLDLRIRRGDRIALIGPNGAGKTTLIRLLMKTLEPTGGTVRHGTRLAAHYLDQTYKDFDPTKTAWEILAPEGGDQILVHGRPKHVVAHLKDFLFSEAQARQPVARLSGGERNRLRLAKFFAAPANLLVLDEPTNDLDVETLELLEDVLSAFDGTVIFVSHDRAFIDGLATHVLAFERGGRITLYAGGYTDYLAQAKAAAQVVSSSAGGRSKPAQPQRTPETKARSKLSYKQQRALEALEREVPELTAEIAKHEAALAAPDLYQKDRARFECLTASLAAARARRAAAEDEWLALEIIRDGGG